MTPEQIHAWAAVAAAIVIPPSVVAFFWVMTRRES